MNPEAASLPVSIALNKGRGFDAELTKNPVASAADRARLSLARHVACKILRRQGSLEEVQKGKIRDEVQD